MSFLGPKIWDILPDNYKDLNSFKVVLKKGRPVNCPCVTERYFAPSLLGFLDSDFALLWYKTLHSEVAWTEENAGKSGFTLFAAWLITLHRVL